MDSEFPSNSQRARRPAEKQEPKKVEQIVQGNVTRRKKPISKRFTEIFVGQNPRLAAESVTFDVLIPAAKDAFLDAVVQGFERVIFGESRSRGRSSSGRPAPGGYTAYNRYSQVPSRREEPQREISRRGRANHDFQEIILDSRVEAEEVIDRLFDLLAKYESASVADLYDMLGVEQSFTDEKWGWRDLRGAGINRIRNGYLLDLPRPEPLDG